MDAAVTSRDEVASPPSSSPSSSPSLSPSSAQDFAASGNSAPVSAKKAAEAPPKARSRRGLIAAAVTVVVAAGGAWWLVAPPTNESTDDAYIGADTTTVAPKVRGLVAEVYVRDNQAVKAGQPLLRIDPEEFESRVAAATGELADAHAQVATAQAALVSLSAEERLAASNVVAADTSIRSSVAESQRAAADHQRYEDLASSGAVAKSDVDRYGAAAVTAAQESAKARALLAVARDTERVTHARRPSLDAALLAAQARVVKAQAALDLARQDQKHATIYAPIDGVVGNRQVQTGDYVQAGSRLLTLVPLHAIYVTANFKETQTERMRPGQTVRIEADALSGTELTGTVESIAPGSGSTFSLLPFEPGTGNFTKIVQRVPVRIRFAPDQAGVDQLRPGLSVTAKVRVKAS